jgi:hypothetical protein
LNTTGLSRFIARAYNELGTEYAQDKQHLLPLFSMDMANNFYKTLIAGMRSLVVNSIQRFLRKEVGAALEKEFGGKRFKNLASRLANLIVRLLTGKEEGERRTFSYPEQHGESRFKLLTLL